LRGSISGNNSGQPVMQSGRKKFKMNIENAHKNLDLLRAVFGSRMSGDHF
jgi:hypothetical protein